MIKSIQNVGESEGGRGVITHSRAYPFVPVLKWSACTPLKKVAKRQIAASKQGKVVIKVVRDFIFVWKPNYTALSLAFCIGEQNRCTDAACLNAPGPYPPSGGRFNSAILHKNIFQKKAMDQ